MSLCPKCKRDVELSPADGTPTGLPHATDVMRCPDCRGLWLSHVGAQILKLAGEPLPDDVPGPAPDADRRAGMCPAGHGLLKRARVDVDDPFYLDRCPTCSGIWFDAGEWNRLATSHLLHSLFELWSPSFLRRQLEERIEATDREALGQKIGPELLGRIEEVAELLHDHPEAKDMLAYLEHKLGH
jgi:Zn-finger nucleic acid-binding protein